MSSIQAGAAKMTTGEKNPLLSDAAVLPTQLSARLMEIVSFVPPCERVLDIGSDHGHVPSYLLENDIAGYAVATDIHADPAETTKRYLRRHGVMHRAEVYHTDGLHGIQLREGDVVVLSGLGGLEIIRVLSEALTDHDGKFPQGILFVLQPQRSVPELRVYLSGGFSLIDEKVCLDREKYYIILSAKWTGKKSLPMSLAQIELGPRLLEKRPPNFISYLHHQKNVLRKHMRARPELAFVLSEIDIILSTNLTENEVR